MTSTVRHRPSILERRVLSQPEGVSTPHGELILVCLTLTRGMTTIIVVRTQHAEPARVVDAGSARIDATYNARDHDDL